jgi:hypothetical protein
LRDGKALESEKDEGLGCGLCYEQRRGVQQGLYCVWSKLKTEFLLINIYKFNSYLTGNTLRLRYKAQPVNAV